MADRRRRRLVAVAGCLLLATVSAGAHAADARPIEVRAHVTFVKRGYVFRNVRLRITRGGKAWRSKSLGTTYFRPPLLRVRDLDADGEPEVLLDTYTGGAHCCFRSRLFYYVPARRAYVATFHDWGNGSYRAKNIDGRNGVELVSSDDRFAYVFTSFAGSFFPLQLWHFEAGRLIDVTREFPGQVALDARRLWREYRDNRRPGADPRGVLAAWAAAEHLLGRGDAAWRTLETIRKRGELGPRAQLRGWPQGRSYLKALRAFLAKTGYA